MVSHLTAEWNERRGCYLIHFHSDNVPLPPAWSIDGCEWFIGEDHQDASDVYPELAEATIVPDGGPYADGWP